MSVRACSNRVFGASDIPGLNQNWGWGGNLTRLSTNPWQVVPHVEGTDKMRR